MKKKILCTILAVSMLLVAVPVFAVTNVSAPGWGGFPQQKKGNSSEGYTRALQTIVKYNNPTSMAVDGIFGSGTRSAVWTFQEKQDGLAVDGVVGKNTWNAMNSKLKNGVRITGSGTGNGSPSTSGGYYGYQVFQSKTNTYTYLYFFRTDINHSNWLDVYVAANGSAPGTWYWVTPRK